MVNNPLSAENFSQLYASLETLDVNQIVSTLLKIVPLREEIWRRMRQALPRARRKRRTRAEMEALGIKSVDNLQSVEHNSKSHVDKDRAVVPRPTHDTSAWKRKSRKGTPAKLYHNKYSHQRQNAGSMGPDSSGLSLGTASPGSNQSDVADKSLPDLDVTQTALTNTMLNSSDLRTGMNPYSMPYPSLPMPYWNAFRMTANQILYNYSNMMMPAPNATLPKTAEYSNVTPHLQSPNQNIESRAEEPEESDDLHITVVDETVEEEEEGPEDLSTRGASDLTDEPQTKNDQVSNHIKDEDISQQTEINCPDCGVAVLLPALTSHLQDQCSARTSTLNTPSPNALTPSLGKNIWESCAVCSESIPGKDMMKHIKQCHALGNSPFHCDICDESFRNKSTLKRHKIVHTSGGGHACSYCAKIFAKPELLRRHEILHTEVKRILWPCSKCDKSFSNKYNLAVHDRMHTGELPFPCSYCSEKFRVKCSMQNHMRSRHPEIFCRSTSPSVESNSSSL